MRRKPKHTRRTTRQSLICAGMLSAAISVPALAADDARIWASQCFQCHGLSVKSNCGIHFCAWGFRRWGLFGQQL